VIFLYLLSGLLAAGMLYEAAGVWRDKRRMPAPGKRFDIGCAVLHLHELGQGSPAVILESGIAASSINWTLVQQQLAQFVRVCSYDRAGFGWSSPCKTPRTVEQMISEIDALLSRAAIPTPYILVGHSFGGLLVRAFAHRHPEKVAGLVLVDPVSVEFWANCPESEIRRLQRGTALSKRGALLARFGVVRFALAAVAAGRRSFPKAIARATAGRGTTVIDRIVGEMRRLPPAMWPIIMSQWSRPQCFDSMAKHLAALPESARTALNMPVPANIPVTILSAETATPQELEERERWAQESEHGRHIQIPNSGHWLQLQYPDAVVNAVLELTERWRTLQRAAAGFSPRITN
jgi:pimeloyl-ACP methyl ester carboxylesterase